MSDRLSEPLLSIIIPTLNEAQAIAEKLPSWQLLQRAGCEIIVADGGSDDNSLSLLCSQVDQLLNSERGRAKQMNVGAAAAAAPWLLFLHADTELTVNTKVFLQQLAASDAAWGFFRLRLSGKQWLFRVIERAINWRSGITLVATGDQCLFVRAEVFRCLSGFADIPLMEDVELCKRLRQLTKPLIISQAVVTSSRRWQQRGIIKTVWLMWSLRLAYFLGVSPQRLAQSYYGRES
jgi:rSAM/selenodomain-associated transferase 2